MGADRHVSSAIDILAPVTVLWADGTRWTGGGRNISVPGSGQPEDRMPHPTMSQRPKGWDLSQLPFDEPCQSTRSGHWVHYPP